MGQKQEFPVTASLVWIDVTVADQKNYPAHELRGSDFEVLVDGRPCPISQFHAVTSGVQNRPSVEQAHVLDRPASAWVRSAVILVDDVALRARHVQQVRDAVLRLITHSDPGDTVTLIAPESGVSATALLPGGAPVLTRELAKVRGCLDQKLARLTSPGELRVLYWSSVERIVAAFRQLEGQVGPKALFVIGPSLPYGDRGGDKLLSRDAYDTVMLASQRAAAPLHLLGYAEPRPPLTGALFREPGAAAKPPLLGAAASLSAAVALDSGGFATADPVAWPATIDRIMRRTEGYYLLGIQPHEAEDTRFHRLEVRVLRKGLRALARKGYFGRAPRAATP